MTRYVIKRLLMLIPVIIGVAVLIFTIMYFTPGDPVKLIAGDTMTAEQHDQIAHELGLDQPFFTRLFKFLKQTFIDFDLGTSYIYNSSVSEELFTRLPRTAIIASVCCFLQVIIAIPLGVTAATHQGGFLDSFCIVLAIIAISVPSFWIAMLFILLFSLNLNWLPSFGIDHWYSYILPCAANCLMGLGSTARQTRSQMLEVIRSDYVVTARAKGVPERTILYSHALPNALIPVITHLGTQFGSALGGTVVIETVFSIPGVGYYMTTAISNRDYPVVMGGVTLLAVLFCLVVFIVDLIYAFIDPRIKAQYEGSQKKRLRKSEKRGQAYA